MLSFTLIDHTSWYEVVFDIAVLIAGVALGVAFGVIFFFHHIATGYTYLNRVSKQRPIDGDDLWIAFAWRGRGPRKEWLREYEAKLHQTPHSIVRLVRERPPDDRTAAESG